MKKIKKNILFFTVMSFVFGFFCAPDLSATKRNAEIAFGAEQEAMREQEVERDVKKRKVTTKSQEIIGTKTGKKFLMVYNDPVLFKEKTREPFNEVFVEGYEEEDWVKFFGMITSSLEKSDLQYFSHTIQNEEKNIVSFVFGSFNFDKTIAYVDHIGTLLLYRGEGLAWKLFSSIFDQYPGIKKIELESKISSKSYYKEHGFTKKVEIGPEKTLKEVEDEGEEEGEDEGADGTVFFELSRESFEAVAKKLEEKIKKS